MGFWGYLWGYWWGYGVICGAGGQAEPAVPPGESLWGYWWGYGVIGGAQQAVWTALAEQGIGASLQHYNPLIDDDIKKEFDLPAEWTLRAQMPFGSIEAPAGDKEFLDEAEQFKLID